MADPAAASARADAQRSGAVVGSDVDRIESAIHSDLDDDGADGAWLDGERPLWGVVDV